jgi:hypothetical protein
MMAFSNHSKKEAIWLKEKNVHNVDIRCLPLMKKKNQWDIGLFMSVETEIVNFERKYLKVNKWPNGFLGGIQWLTIQEKMRFFTVEVVDANSNRVKANVV